MENFEDLLNPNIYKRELIKCYKDLFSGLIKENFLISTLNTIRTDPRYGVMFISKANPNTALGPYAAIKGKSWTDIDICKMITMNHYVNSLSLSDLERGKIQESTKYRDKLINDVFNMYTIDKIAACDFGSCSLEGYLPIIYYCSALNNFCGNKYDELNLIEGVFSKNYNKNFNLNMLYKIIYKIKACVCLADIRAVDELATIFRTLIESVLIYAALWDGSDKEINSYLEFSDAAFGKNYGKDIPEHMKLLAKDMGVKDISFVNYGWIKNLKLYQEIKTKSIGLATLAEIVDKKCSYFCPKFGTTLHKIYKACNPQAHSTILFMNYFELELHIFNNIAVVCKFITEIMGTKLSSFETIYEGHDLIDLLNVALDDSRKLFDWVHNEQKNLQKTNKDYINRARFSLKMKN